DPVQCRPPSLAPSRSVTGRGCRRLPARRAGRAPGSGTGRGSRVPRAPPKHRRSHRARGKKPETTFNSLVVMRVEIASSKPAEERNEKLNLTGRPDAVRFLRVAEGAWRPGT